MSRIALRVIGSATVVALLVGAGVAPAGAATSVDDEAVRHSVTAGVTEASVADGFDTDLTTHWNVNIGLLDVASSTLDALKAASMTFVGGVFSQQSSFTDTPISGLWDDNAHGYTKFEVSYKVHETIANLKGMGPAHNEDGGSFVLADTSSVLVFLDANAKVITAMYLIAWQYKTPSGVLGYFWANSTRYRYLFAETVDIAATASSPRASEVIVPNTYLPDLSDTGISPTETPACTAFRVLEAIMYIPGAGACALTTASFCLVLAALDYLFGVLAQESCYGD